MKPTAKTRLDELAATPENISKLEELHRIVKARESRAPPDAVEFVLVDPSERKE